MQLFLFFVILRSIYTKIILLSEVFTTFQKKNLFHLKNGRDPKVIKKLIEIGNIIDKNYKFSKKNLAI